MKLPLRRTAAPLICALLTAATLSMSVQATEHDVDETATPATEQSKKEAIHSHQEMKTGIPVNSSPQKKAEGNTAEDQSESKPIHSHPEMKTGIPVPPTTEEDTSSGGEEEKSKPIHSHQEMKTGITVPDSSKSTKE
jgi:uncharacterized membrane protein YraQ (UPF0718 family)